MCRWRQIQDTFKFCGHILRQPDQLLQCGDRYCKFSTIHPDDCGPNCKTSCWQYRQFPEQINRTLDKLCPHCQLAYGG